MKKMGYFIIGCIIVVLTNGCSMKNIANDNIVYEAENQTKEESANNSKLSDIVRRVVEILQNIDKKVEYTDDELCEMARNYYMYMNGTDYIPEIIEVEHEKEDGIVVIHLYDILETHRVTSDWYMVDRASAKGEDIMGEKICLLDVAQINMGYADNELCEMARNYYMYINETDDVPDIVEVDNEQEDGIVAIHLYEILETHTTTYDWYMVNRISTKGKNILGEDICLLDCE